MYEPRYNARPSQALPVILNREPQQIEMVRLGNHSAVEGFFSVMKLKQEGYQAVGLQAFVESWR